MFNNIPQVTKNLLILNVLFFLATIIFESSYGIRLSHYLGVHYINTPLFKPFQIVTHMFMHSGLRHIFFNMFALVLFGSLLENLWGPKRYFIFYLTCGIGAFLVMNVAGMWEVNSLKSILSDAGVDIQVLNNRLRDGYSTITNDDYINSLIDDYAKMSLTPMVGASGAIFGISAAFALLFPNTEISLFLIPIPIRVKYLIGAYFLLELYYSFNQPGDSIAHLAHVGGAIVGGTIVLIQKKRDKTNFW